ncbi:hypothetical protein HELRODRAFT_186068 [Helobdella robusta]|uniref:Proteasome activator PA28 C-terminal domain-containing protein n=1 Tax=Helobdella robusta TaxID=6412 RepID=T1FNM4_HELRO|nr:hypothetical protein HELRODRAFT_186068 [Helobdella robusta]ESN93698.1 hypothetical protein HELRODRAFT_186068 [Helobdella robusta]
MSHDRKRGAKSIQPVMSEAETQVEELKNKTKAKGEQLIKETIPKKILELNKLLESDIFSMSRYKSVIVKLNIPVPEVTSSPRLAINCENAKKRKMDCLEDVENIGTKVYSIPGGSVPLNTQLADLLDLIKPHAIEQVEIANQVKMWITFMVPKIEDGNNFGVSIQEDSITEARQVETEAAACLDQVSRYFLMRGKIVSKVAKYPHVDDYRRAVQELDEKEFISVKLALTEIRNNYASLHDLVSKNMDKIKKPRSANTDNMY